jgi:hypothetical protein
MKIAKEKKISGIKNGKKTANSEMVFPNTFGHHYTNLGQKIHILD